MGQQAAAHVCALLARTLALQPRARVIFACAPSQNEFLAELILQSRGSVDWSRVDGFHMDEYIGLGAKHPASSAPTSGGTSSTTSPSAASPKSKGKPRTPRRKPLATPICSRLRPSTSSA